MQRRRLPRHLLRRTAADGLIRTGRTAGRYARPRRRERPRFTPPARPGGSGCAAIRGRAAAATDSVYLADMPAAAQLTRVYDEYRQTLATTPAEDVEYYAVSIVGPRNRVDKIVGRLPLL
ncbi:DUF2000 family protein [Leifsonia sp. P73]|uniref:DUF2000 family protein n=1 Tax=Leifsonia sp. P73 TaxID=3423959 RepID=UPI003DA34C29